MPRENQQFMIGMKNGKAWTQVNLYNLKIVIKQTKTQPHFTKKQTKTCWRSKILAILTQFGKIMIRTKFLPWQLILRQTNILSKLFIKQGCQMIIIWLKSPMNVRPHTYVLQSIPLNLLKNQLKDHHFWENLKILKEVNKWIIL